MFEGDYCPNCDNYIKALETENDEMRKELKALREERTKLIAYAYIRIDPTGWEDDPMQEIISAEGEAALEQGEVSDE